MPDEDKHVYESVTLGLPPLRMVLVHARNDAQNAASGAAVAEVEPVPAEAEPLDKELAVKRIIKHLEDSNP